MPGARQVPYGPENGGAMLSIVQASEQRHFDDVDDLTWEYMVWTADRARELYGWRYDLAAAHERDIAGRAKYLPPNGRLLLASVDGASAGSVHLHHLDPSTGEVKRLYVRPAYRGHGVGRELLNRLIREARDMGLERLVLDSGRFQQAAHTLYRRTGFVDIAPYDQSEAPEPYRRHMVFMELRLRD